MKRIQAVSFAKKHGWKAWGKLRKKNGSHYQCFRRKNKYCWIGLRYVEHQDSGVAEDFIVFGNKALEMIV